MQIYSHVFETWQKGLKKSVYFKKNAHWLIVAVNL